LTTSKSRIELEMFEVGLGSSIYLRLRRSDGDLRILADGGVGQGYRLGHVQSKVADLLKHEDASRLDLVIGTHYDEDHLRGLKPILDSPIEVGELWLPPVIDDTIEVVGDAMPRDGELLGVRLAEDQDYLARYLDIKVAAIRMCREVELALGTDSERRDFSDLGAPIQVDGPELLQRLRSEFAAGASDARNDDGCEHVGDADVLEEAYPHRFHQFLSSSDYLWALGRIHRASEHLSFANFLRSRGQHSAAAFSIARIRDGAAKDAINAIALNDLVQAAKRKKIDICYRHIQKGRPNVFHWVASDRRFIRGGSSSPDAILMTLLGPSTSLIVKHANRLPVNESITLAMMSRIPVKSISPSNQLSYVMKIEHAEQAMLICGDSGFSDFMVTRHVAEPLMLAELQRLNVIQVAHHGGNNQWFYPVLVEAWKDRAAPVPIMLLSHAHEDRHRPNKQFEQFVEEVAADSDERFVVFTSKPRPDRIEAFRDKVMRPVGTVSRVGDVRLQFASGRWELSRHAIDVESD